MKIRPVGAELINADRRTHMTKVTDGFRNFANVPKMSALFPLPYIYNNNSKALKLTLQSPP
jgi:hypothetical protein